MDFIKSATLSKPYVSGKNVDVAMEWGWAFMKGHSWKRTHTKLITKL